MSNILKQLTLENISDKATAFTVGGTPVVTYVFIAFSGALLGYILTRPDNGAAEATKKEEPTPKPEAVVEEAAVADGGDEGEKVGGRRTRKKRKSKRKSKSKKHRYKLMNRENI